MTAHEESPLPEQEANPSHQRTFPIPDGHPLPTGRRGS